MMIQCDRHGYQYGIQVSQDLAAEVRQGKRLRAYKEIVYEYGGEEQERVLVSLHFVSQEGLSKAGVLPLPEQYPGWYDKLMVVCEKCVDVCTAH